MNLFDHHQHHSHYHKSKLSCIYIRACLAAWSRYRGERTMNGRRAQSRSGWRAEHINLRLGSPIPGITILGFMMVLIIESIVFRDQSDASKTAYDKVL